MFWPFIPQDISEKLTFSTDVSSTRMAETRTSLHDAVSVFSMSYVSLDDRAARIEQVVRDNILGSWTMPVWPSLSWLQASASIGDTTLSVETNADYRVGGQVVVVGSESTYEIADIVSITDGVVSLAAPLSQAWGADALTAPVGHFILPAGLAQSIAPIATTMSFDFYRTDPADLGADLLDTFSGFDIWLDPPGVLSGLEGGLARKLDFIQNGFGTMAIEGVEAFTRWRGMLGHTDTTAAARWRRRKLLHRMRGKDRPFWLPTWKHDLALSQPSTAGSTTLFFTNINTDPALLIGRKVQISTGTQLAHRTINNATTIAGAIRITLDQQHGFAVPKDAKVSWIRLVRFDTDVFELRHRMAVGGFSTVFAAPVVEVAG